MAQPSDNVLHGKWWEMFNDPELNALEEKVNISNQNIASAMASYLAARALVKEARSQYFPTVGVDPAITESRQGAARSLASNSGLRLFYSLPFDASWVPDLWGRVRNQVRANTAAAQASAADLENMRLTAQAEVAVDYYKLRGQDALKQLLDSTVIAYQESLDLTKVLYETGIDSDEAVAQAETQLETTQAADTNLGILRAQYEHAIAMLVGQPASTFSIPAEPLKPSPPAIPFGVPSQLLERRPDIAANERLMAQANAQIGVATLRTIRRSLSARHLAGVAVVHWLVYVAEPILFGGAQLVRNDLRWRLAPCHRQAISRAIRRDRSELPSDGVDGLSAGGR